MSLHPLFSNHEVHFVAGTAQWPEWKISLKEKYRLETKL
jgi:hypothetical protein